MNRKDDEFVENFFLHVPVNPKIGIKRNEEPPDPSPALRVEMKTLQLSGDTQKMILETLRHIHGEDFQLKKASVYSDKGMNLGNKYWMERGNLIVQGGCDYSIKRDEVTTSEDKFRMFALKKLESYGFHKTHCVEAIDYVDGQIEEALCVLYSKYYDIDQSLEKHCDISPEEINEQKHDEKAVLHSIYESSFKEKESNVLWEITLNLDYLLKLNKDKQKAPSISVKENINYNNRNNNFKTKKEEPCRNFLKGNCKFGNKCRFSHAVANKVIEKKEGENDDGTIIQFFLEIRFPPNCKYPYQSPFIFLKTNAPENVMPKMTCLQICRILITEADSLALDGIPSVYSIIDLIQNEERILEFLKTDNKKFPNASQPLFPVIDDSAENVKKILPSHYERAVIKDIKSNLSFQDIVKEDNNIAKKFIEKQKNPQFKKMLEDRRKLPAWGKMNEILNAIENTQVIVICGETGCGKSTQVPQFILDDWLLQRAKTECETHVDIVCTQPRRISAIGVADRVAEERVERTGNTIGYQIRLESNISTKTRLTFCTTGILLRRLESDPKLESVTHILVDEVHERSEESDFLLLILKDLLSSRKDLKVILMSATMNANLFSDYFGGVPVLEIPGRTFPVEQLFLEDILECSGYILEENSTYARRIKKSQEEEIEIDMATSDILAANSAPKVNLRDENLNLPQMIARYRKYSGLTCKNMYFMDPEKVNLELIENILTYIVEGNHEWPKEGAILIFLPGLSEITSLHEQLCDSKIFNPRNGNYVLVPLHSTLTSEEQAAVFHKPKKGVRKIVLSTNIAETSVTIDDCVFVIDSGKMKEKRFDSNRNMESLDTIWVSRANALQRKGRAGRVMAGVCIHLFTSHRFEHHMLHQPIPELHRVPLEQLILRIKVLPLFEGMEVPNVLGGTLEPPSNENIIGAMVRLQDVGALDRGMDLTPLGAHLAALPVDVRIGKLMLFGAIFSCVDSALTIAACLSYKNPFVAPFGKKQQADAKKKEFAVNNSDQLTVLRAYKKWQYALSQSRYAAQEFANLNYLSLKTLYMLADIKHQLLDLLASIGFVPALNNSRRSKGVDKVMTLTGTEFNANGDNHKLLSAILCAALYPNVVKVLTPEKSFHLSAGGAVPRQPKPEDLKFKTKQDGYVFLHPTSVNYTISHFPSPYLVYQEKVKTSRIFIRDCSMVALLPLILFSGCQLSIELHRGTFVLSLEDGWIMFQVEAHEVAEMIKVIRTEFINLFEEKIRDPSLNLLHHENGIKVISTIVHIVTNE